MPSLLTRNCWPTLGLASRHLTHLAALHAAWQNTRCATIKHEVHLAVTQQTISCIEQQAQTPSGFRVFRQVLLVHPPIPRTLPFQDTAHDKVWLAVVRDSKVNANLNLPANIDMFQPDPAHWGDTMAPQF